MTTVADTALTGAREPSTVATWRYDLFVRMWSAAALFHLAGNARDALTGAPALAVASALLGVAALLALAAPLRRTGLLGLCVLVPVTAWLEAPVVGNHWVLAAAISLALLGSAAVAARLGSGGVEAVWRTFVPVARLTLVAAYGFAAFAKLNSDFFDPAVSCAVSYHNELVDSWGLQLLHVTDGAASGRLLPFVAAATEVTVALALALPRTRRLGLVLAVGFHWVLAMDLAQHFWDFSAVLFACFFLFLDDGQVLRLRALVRRVGAHRWWPTSLVRVVVVTWALAVTALNVLPVPPALDVLLVVLGHLAWWAYGTGAVLLVLGLVRAGRAAAGDGGPTRPSGWILWAVPALVVLNGLTPYLEVKTGFGWNMYSNLRTVDGESNHVLIGSTLDLTGVQADRVRIVESSDPALARLAEEEYAVAWSEFREYAHAHPDVAVTYERGGDLVRAARLGDDPAGQGGVTELGRRLQSFRVIDVSGSERCQPVFSPAR